MTNGAPRVTRNTRQRAQVLALLDSVADFRSAQQLYMDLRGRGEAVGLTTIYRTLQTLVDAGEVDMMRLDNTEQLYRRCSRSHHHHLVCRVCGRTVEIDGHGIESWSAEVAAKHGFTQVGHILEIIGTCDQCATAAT